MPNHILAVSLHMSVHTKVDVMLKMIADVARKPTPPHLALASRACNDFGRLLQWARSTAQPKGSDVEQTGEKLARVMVKSCKDVLSQAELATITESGAGWCNMSIDVMGGGKVIVPAQSLCRATCQVCHTSDDPEN